REILRRRKAGFPVPWAAWLRAELKDWVSGILLDRETLSRGYFKPSAVEKLVKMNVESGSFSKEILSLVSLELWHRTFLEDRTESPAAPASDSPQLIPQG
ncbi:MAG TPA: asparagine synthase-related protein, partial [Candidatus Angelobacter sp.]|nr:asparagine synthase-related protein [Candidatus Angelobacter sp.]